MAAEKFSIEVEQHEPLQRRAAGTDTGDGKKCIGSGNPYANVTVTVGDAFAIENVTAVNEFLLELFKVAGIESGSD